MSDGMKIDKSSNVRKRTVEMAGAEGVDIRRLISRDDGAPNFEMRMFELAPGGHTPLHTHPHEHEVFIVEGEGAFVFEGQEHPFEAEHFIFVPGGSEHCFKNTGESILRFLCIIPSDAS
ncbi:MAG: cupin domain-containing protein [Planctomycetota bacterium]|jgi:quercetin dioxygenase-like cupin family protein